VTTSNKVPPKVSSEIRASELTEFSLCVFASLRELCADLVLRVRFRAKLAKTRKDGKILSNGHNLDKA